jgi:hypothetical protein
MISNGKLLSWQAKISGESLIISGRVPKMKVMSDIVGKLYQILSLPKVRVVLLVTGWFAVVILLFFFSNQKFTYNTSITTPSFEVPKLLSTTYHWDSGYYLSIAEKGYDSTTPNQYAFFPLYSLLIRWVSVLTGNLVTAAILINYFSLVVTALSLVSITRRLLPGVVQTLPLFLLLVFPSAYFLAGVYGESLFLALSLGAYLLALQKRWWLAALVAGFASAGRVPGSLVSLLVIFLFLESNNWKLRVKDVPKFIAIILISCAGILVYSLFLHRELGSVWQLREIYQTYWPLRELNLNIIETVLQWLRSIIWYARIGNYPAFFDVLLPVSMWMVSFSLLVSYWRKLPLSLSLFTLTNLILLAATTAYDSINRYLLPVFPIYLLLALVFQKKGEAYQLYLLLSALLMGVMAAAFATNFWTG